LADRMVSAVGAVMPGWCPVLVSDRRRVARPEGGTVGWWEAVLAGEIPWPGSATS
jgi:hypothetical protein